MTRFSVFSRPLLTIFISIPFFQLISAGFSQLKFGDHVTDQCNNPIATITSGNELKIFPPRDSLGRCNFDICLGDCVAVVVDAGGSKGKSGPINIIVGNDLPNPVNCSSVAAGRNVPPGWDFTHTVAAGRNVPPGWDFTHTGMCGKGKSGDGYWQNCLVHDVCVWARCTDDYVIPGGASFAWEEGAVDDEFCGNSAGHAATDWRKANGYVIGCGADSGCPDPMICSLGKCFYPRPEGDYCDDDSDCEGYCSFFRCWSGNEGDPCEKDSDCQGYCELLKCYNGSEGDRCGRDEDCHGDLTCFGAAGSARCEKKGAEGALCGSDADCLGYCELLRCYDGSEGDRCGKDSDCQGDLTCFGAAGSARCSRKKGEGAKCGSDADCLGYCQLLRCYDGSKGDRCQKSSDCKSRSCRWRRCK